MSSTGRKRRSMSADEEDEDEVNVPSKRLKSVSNPSPAAGALPDVTLDEDGNAYWEIAPKRRIVVSEFKGMTMVGVREFYSKDDGKLLPGKKGISMPLPQFAKMVSFLPQIEATLRAKGEELPRPRYEAGSSDSKSGDAGSKSAKAAKEKQNFEETSEDD